MQKLFATAIACCYLLFAVSQKDSFSQGKGLRSLIGDTYLLTLFIDTNTDTWEEDEMDYAYSELLKSQDWLIDQAGKYSQKINFKGEFLFDNKRKLFIPTIQRSYNPSYNDQLFRKLGYKDRDEYFSRNRLDLSKNKFSVILFVKENGVSHVRNKFPTKATDYAFIYSSDLDEFLKYILAHEILHLFGAWDLYYGASQTYHKELLATKMFPNSIMSNKWTHVDSLVVDELTAWRVGWNNNYKKHFADFTPDYDPNRIQNDIKSNETKPITFDLARKKKGTQKIKLALYKSHSLEDIQQIVKKRIESTDKKYYYFTLVVTDKESMKICRRNLKLALRNLNINSNQYKLRILIG